MSLCGRTTTCYLAVVSVILLIVHLHSGNCKQLASYVAKINGYSVTRCLTFSIHLQLKAAPCSQIVVTFRLEMTTAPLVSPVAVRPLLPATSSSAVGGSPDGGHTCSLGVATTMKMSTASGSKCGDQDQQWRVTGATIW